MSRNASPEAGLYDIPEVSYQVSIEAFQGPLDLLLHLIRKNEVNIYDIPISDITRQYLEYVKLMKEFNLDVAGEFLVMASTLLQIKSRMLLPLPAEDEGEEEEEDPRAELVRRLLEYEKYKEAGKTLDQRELLGRDIFARTFPAAERETLGGEESPVEVDLFELVEAFRSLLERIPVEVFHDVAAETVSIADRMNQVLETLLQREAVSFTDLFSSDRTREDVVVTFLAILELCRLKALRIVQTEEHGRIWLTPAVREPVGEEDDLD